MSTETDWNLALWEMRRANSLGRHEEARCLSARVRRIPALPVEVRCDALMHAFFASHRLGQPTQALLAEIAEISPALSSESPVLAQLQALLQTLGVPCDLPEVAPPYAPPPDAWATCEPASTGLDPGAMGRFSDYCQRSGADAFLVAHRGRIVAESYASTYRLPMPSMSSVKSITALLMGLLLEDGRIGHVDDPVHVYLPDWRGPWRDRVTLRQLLTMTAGLPADDPDGASLARAADKTAYVLGLEPVRQPGTHWEYSNAAAQLLSPILQEAAGIPLHEYARLRLFEPLAMHQTRLVVGPAGDVWTHADAFTTLRDLAKPGLLMLRQGRWGSHQLISRAWMQACSTSCPLNPDYGYLWWLYRNPTACAMRGYLNTSVWVFPSCDLLVARMQARPHLHALDEFSLEAALPYLRAALRTTAF